MKLTVFANMAIAIVVVFTAGCGLVKKEPTTELEQDVENKTFVAPDSKTSKPVLALIHKARSAATQGNIAQARADIERALRIEPRNASIWHYLGKLSLQQKKYKEAINFARKSNQLLSHQPSRSDSVIRMEQDNWRLVAHAKYQAGDIDGAKKAQQKANQLDK